MALVAVKKSSGKELESFSIPDTEWAAMCEEPKGSYVMLGTNWPAVLKRSIRGTQFFAYAPGFTGSKPKPESEEHRVIKMAIAQALRNAGYTAEVERSGNSSKGDPWQADVLCYANGRKIAFEVQLSQQTLEEYERRSEIYRNSGIQPIWLMKHHKTFVKAACYRLQKQGKKIEELGCGHVPTVPFVYLQIDKEKPFALDRVRVIVAHHAEKKLREFSVSDCAVALATGLFDFEEVARVSHDGKMYKFWLWQLSASA